MLFQPDQQAVEDATVALRDFNPKVANVVDATRSYSVLGLPRTLTARLADGSQWLIDGSGVRQLSAEEIAERLRRHESFR